jgi:hypothetical protein
MIAVDIALLGFSCSAVGGAFDERRYQLVSRWRIPLDSWQRQARVVALAVVAPLCGLIVNLATPPSFDVTYAYLVVMFVVLCWPLIVVGLLALP